nr:pollen-specific leucine-rich repeat extensin-like protein 3 [Penaeus vannamei]
MGFLTWLFRSRKCTLSRAQLLQGVYLLPRCPLPHPSPPTLCPLTPSECTPAAHSLPPSQPPVPSPPASSAHNRPPFVPPVPTHRMLLPPPSTHNPPSPLSLIPAPTAHSPIHFRLAPCAHCPLPPTTTTHERDPSHLD